MTQSDQTSSPSAVPEPWQLLAEHPACRLDGCTVTSAVAGVLAFHFRRPGQCMVVLQASAPLQIVEQRGLTARLLPGWDGTLGYCLYALEIETSAAGTGQVRLAAAPLPAPAAPFFEAFAARSSRFPEDPAAFRRWQREWRARLTQQLLPGGLPARVLPAAEVLSTEAHASFTLQRISYQTQPDRRNTLLLALPRQTSGRVPLLLALHGHEGAWGEADAGAFTTPGHADDFCAYFAERGWAVVQPATMEHTLQHAGWTLQGEWTWDAMVALDYALQQPEVDAARVAVCGLSTGAFLAMHLLALDERVHAGVVGCILSSWHHLQQRLRIPPHCDCGILAQLSAWLEQCDWAALAAPRPVQFQHGRQDGVYYPGADPALLKPAWNTGVMPKDEFAAVFAEVARAYRVAGAAEQVHLHLHEDGHRVDGAAAYRFLNSLA